MKFQDDNSTKKKSLKTSKKDKKKSSKTQNGNVSNNDQFVKNEPEESIEQKEGNFNNFRISNKTIKQLKKINVTHLFKVQSKTFDYIYDGNDVIAQARTGTGKTFSFAIPLIERLEKMDKRGRHPRVLVMVPTRELAKQVSDNFSSLNDELAVSCIYGGVAYEKQKFEIGKGIDIVVGTPGRLKDLVERRVLCLTSLKHVVLDEVDRMLDMGFSDIVEEILRYAYDLSGTKDKNPQTLLFSATTPAWVFKTGKKYMKDDAKIVDLVGSEINRTAENVQHLAIKCNYSDRAATVGDVLQVYSGQHGRAMVFAPTKRDADELTVSPAIRQEGHVLHGDIPQDKREMVLSGFREGKYKVLITTDVAARGLDIPEVDLVIQLEPPKDVDSYIHRSGRTGRAGRSGVCVCFYKPRAEYDLKFVEQKAGIKFKRIGPPTPQDIINSAASDASKSLEIVDPKVFEQFREAAKKVLDKMESTEALARALAVLSGTQQIEERSLLTSRRGYKTYIYKTNVEMRGPGLLFSVLQKRIGCDMAPGIDEIRIISDKMGCVFDVKNDYINYFETKWANGNYDSLEIAKELPEIIEQNRNGYSNRSNYSQNGGRNGFNNRNNFSRNNYGQARSFGRRRQETPIARPMKRSLNVSSRDNITNNKRIKFNE